MRWGLALHRQVMKARILPLRLMMGWNVLFFSIQRSRQNFPSTVFFVVLNVFEIWGLGILSNVICYCNSPAVFFLLIQVAIVCVTLHMN